MKNVLSETVILLYLFQRHQWHNQNEVFWKFSSELLNVFLNHTNILYLEFTTFQCFLITSRTVSFFIKYTSNLQ